MKKLILILAFLSSHSFANYSKPELVARYAVIDPWNAPPVMACFSGEPWVERNRVFLNCFDNEGRFMVEWAPQFKVLARAQTETYFSAPTLAGRVLSWHEFEEWGTKRAWGYDGKSVRSTSITNLGSPDLPNDSFLSVGPSTYIFRLKGETPKLGLWQRGQQRIIFDRPVQHIFPPVVGSAGEILLKTREGKLDESGADRLWIWKNGWKLIVEDREANYKSRFRSFRHQLAIEGEKVVFIAHDGLQEAIYLWNAGEIRELARVGKDFKALDYFAPKIRGNTIAVRGVDSRHRKAVYVINPKGIQQLITQGDVVGTDKGPGVIHYTSQDAIFYGAPAIGPAGEIVIQATLTKPGNPEELLGVGVLRYSPR